MKCQKTIRVGIFLLRDVILYPYTSLPFSIRDETCQKMIADSLQQNFPIAVGLGDPVFLPDGRVSKNMGLPKQIMGLGIPEVLDRDGDGTQYILFQGVGKVQITRILSNSPYMLCEAKVLSDNESTLNSLTPNPTKRLEQVLNRWLVNNIEDPDYLQSTLKNITTVPQVMDYLATFLVQDRELKQMLLETHDLAERIQLLDVLFPKKEAERENLFSGEVLKQFEYDDCLRGGIEN